MYIHHSYMLCGHMYIIYTCKKFHVLKPHMYILYYCIHFDRCPKIVKSCIVFVQALSNSYTYAAVVTEAKCYCVELFAAELDLSTGTKPCEVFRLGSVSGKRILI